MRPKFAAVVESLKQQPPRPTTIAGHQTPLALTQRKSDAAHQLRLS
jgi:hypothetical protein